MFTDSRIMERVIDRCTGQGLPVLTVHDSVIAPYTHSRVVQETMREAATEVVGRELPVEAEHQGLDRWEDVPVHVRQEFEAWRETRRCEGYLRRLEEWERAAGWEVVPFRTTN